METCFNYCSPDAGYFSSDERRWITKIRKLKQQFPDLVTIIAEPETNDGCIYAKMPIRFLRLQGPSTRVEMTEEQKAELKRKLAEGRARKLASQQR